MQTKEERIKYYEAHIAWGNAQMQNGNTNPLIVLANDKYKIALAELIDGIRDF